MFDDTLPDGNINYDVMVGNEIANEQGEMIGNEREM